MSERTEWLDLIHSAQNTTAQIAEYLYWLADAFKATGNQKVEQDLRDCGDDLKLATEEIRQATDQVTSEIASFARESAQNMVMAALAVATKQEDE